MSKFTLSVEKREVVGKGASRRLRREQGLLPGILYGGSEAPQNLTLVHKDLFKATEDESFFSSLITLDIDGTEVQAIVKDLQRHPAKPIIQHIDFQRAIDDQPMLVSVPLHFLNEESCPGVKLQGGIASHNLALLEVRCLPKDLPSYIEVDMAEANAGDVVHISDLKLPEGVSSTALSLGKDHDLPVAKIKITKK